MLEFLTQAIVIDSKPQKENDRVVDLFTKDYGRLKVKVISGRKTLSKLSPHLDMFNLVTVRLIQKNSIILTDVLTNERFKKERVSEKFYPVAFKIINLIKALTPQAEPNIQLWHMLIRCLRNQDSNITGFLKIFGYDPTHATCGNCGRMPVITFRAQDQSFFCRECGFKTRVDELIYL